MKEQLPYFLVFMLFLSQATTEHGSFSDMKHLSHGSHPESYQTTTRGLRTERDGTRQNDSKRTEEARSSKDQVEGVLLELKNLGKELSHIWGRTQDDKPFKGIRRNDHEGIEEVKSRTTEEAKSIRTEEDGGLILQLKNLGKELSQIWGRTQDKPFKGIRITDHKGIEEAGSRKTHEAKSIRKDVAEGLIVQLKNLGKRLYHIWNNRSVQEEGQVKANKGRGRKDHGLIFVFSVAAAYFVSGLVTISAALIKLFIVQALFASKLAVIIGSYIVLTKLLQYKEVKSRTEVYKHKIEPAHHVIPYHAPPQPTYSLSHASGEVELELVQKPGGHHIEQGGHHIEQGGHHIEQSGHHIEPTHIQFENSYPAISPHSISGSRNIAEMHTISGSHNIGEIRGSHNIAEMHAIGGSHIGEIQGTGGSHNIGQMYSVGEPSNIGGSIHQSFGKGFSASTSQSHSTAQSNNIAYNSIVEPPGAGSIHQSFGKGFSASPSQGIGESHSASQSNNIAYNSIVEQPGAESYDIQHSQGVQFENGFSIPPSGGIGESHGTDGINSYQTVETNAFTGDSNGFKPSHPNSFQGADSNRFSGYDASDLNKGYITFPGTNEIKNGYGKVDATDLNKGYKTFPGTKDISGYGKVDATTYRGVSAKRFNALHGYMFQEPDEKVFSKGGSGMKMAYSGASSVSVEQTPASPAILKHSYSIHEPSVEPTSTSDQFRQVNFTRPEPSRNSPIHVVSTDTFTSRPIVARR